MTREGPSSSGSWRPQGRVSRGAAAQSAAQMRGRRGRRRRARRRRRCAGTQARHPMSDPPGIRQRGLLPVLLGPCGQRRRGRARMADRMVEQLLLQLKPATQGWRRVARWGGYSKGSAASQGCPRAPSDRCHLPQRGWPRHGRQPSPTAAYARRRAACCAPPRSARPRILCACEWRYAARGLAVASSSHSPCAYPQQCRLRAPRARAAPLRTCTGSTQDPKVSK